MYNTHNTLCDAHKKSYKHWTFDISKNIKCEWPPLSGWKTRKGPYNSETSSPTSTLHILWRNAPTSSLYTKLVHKNLKDGNSAPFRRQRRRNNTTRQPPRVQPLGQDPGPPTGWTATIPTINNCIERRKKSFRISKCEHFLSSLTYTDFLNVGILSFIVL